MARVNLSPIDPGFFRIKTAADLLQKIVREQRRFRSQSTPGNDDLAFNICLSIAHWPEWFAGEHGSQSSPPITAGGIRASNPCLRLCLELANNAKHWGRDKPPVGGVFMAQSTAAQSMVGLSPEGREIPWEEIVINVAGWPPNMPVREVFDSAIREMAQLMRLDAAMLL